MASGEMTPKRFAEFLHAVFANATRLSLDGAIHYICMDWRHIEELLTATKTLYSEFKNVCVWNKDNGGMGSLYRSKHELVFVFKVGTGPHVNNIDLGRTGRYRTNVWDQRRDHPRHYEGDRLAAAFPRLRRHDRWCVHDNNLLCDIAFIA